MSLNNAGKKICSVSKKKKYIVIATKDETIRVTYDTWLEHKLYTGKRLLDDEINELKTLEKLNKHLEYAINIASKMLRSENEIRTKLNKRELSSWNIEFIIQKLKQSNLIDDDKYVEAFVSSFNNQNYGKLRIKQKLEQKGIYKDIDIDDETEFIKAISHLEKLEKKYSSKPNKVKCERIKDSLKRLGFESQIINRVRKFIKINDYRNELLILKKDYQKAMSRYLKKYKTNEAINKTVTYLLSKGYRYEDIEKVKGERS